MDKKTRPKTTYEFTESEIYTSDLCLDRLLKELKGCVTNEDIDDLLAAIPEKGAMKNIKIMLQMVKICSAICPVDMKKMMDEFWQEKKKIDG